MIARVFFASLQPCAPKCSLCPGWEQGAKSKGLLPALCALLFAFSTGGFIMRKRFLGLVVLAVLLALGSTGASVSLGEGDALTAIEGGYWHDSPCCMGDMQGPGELCWHSTDELK